VKKGDSKLNAPVGIEIAPQTIYETDFEIVRRILMSIRHEEALVTDRSSLNDFTSSEKEGVKLLGQLNREFGIIFDERHIRTSFKDLIAYIKQNSG